ncbi:MAG: hypothetical protein O3A51_03390 [Verrucomicrobia bacterium]|nr:hypothetical protein [Verrucomicrobiota bacterium]
MNIVIADTFSEDGRAGLAAEGHQIVYEPKQEGDELTATLRRVNPTILVVRSTKVTAAMLQAAPALALVVRAGAGVNTIDVAAAAKSAVAVANCPGRNAVAVAELTMGLMLALDRQIRATWLRYVRATGTSRLSVVHVASRGAPWA